MKALITLLITGLSIQVSMLVYPSFAQDDSTYLLPPQFIRNPSFTMYSAVNRKFTGIPSMAISPGGRLWAIWYAGVTPGEDHNNYVVVATSNDWGDNWEEVLAIDPDGPGPARSFDPQAWMDPEGKLWLFWSQRQNIPEGRPKDGVWTITTTEPDSDHPLWSEPMRLSDGVMMNKPVILSSGEWILPVSFWHLRGEGEQSATMLVSTDKGMIWSVRGGVHVPEDARNFDEHMIIELNDGSLRMFVRTTYGIGESISNDRGVTWSSLVPSEIKNPTARFFIRRLISDNLILVKNGPVDMRTGRSHMMAFISEDEGLTWSNGLLLDERLGVSYPDGQQFEDGTIHIIYDYSRTGDQNILMTSFREDDVILCSDRKMIEAWQRRRVVSKGGQE